MGKVLRFLSDYKMFICWTHLQYKHQISMKPTFQSSLLVLRNDNKRDMTEDDSRISARPTHSDRCWCWGSLGYTTWVQPHPKSLIPLRSDIHRVTLKTKSKAGGSFKHSGNPTSSCSQDKAMPQQPGHELTHVLYVWKSRHISSRFELGLWDPRWTAVSILRDGPLMHL